MAFEFLDRRNERVLGKVANEPYLGLPLVRRLLLFEKRKSHLLSHKELLGELDFRVRLKAR